MCVCVCRVTQRLLLAPFLTPDPCCCEARQVLDILEDYLTMRRRRYCRIDGSVDWREREIMVQFASLHPACSLCAIGG